MGKTEPMENWHQHYVLLSVESSSNSVDQKSVDGNETFVLAIMEK